MKATFQREIGALERVFEFTGRFAASRRLGESIRYAMNLAVEELFTNIVKYGGTGGRDIDIDIDIDGGELVIEIVDAGAELFDPTQATEVDVDRPLEERREGGLGIHIIRSIMDYMSYEYHDGTSRIVMKKRLEAGDV